MAMRSLQGKSVLVTGAAGGLGIEFSTQLIELGADLVLAGRNAPKLEKAIKSLPPGPGNILGAVISDISTTEGCQKLFEETTGITPEIDMLLLNAGIINYGEFKDIPNEHWENLMAVNLMAPMRLSRLFIPRMVERASGHIVFVCSLAGIAATALSAPYAASKFGMRGFAMSLSGELKDKGVTVTIVYPSWINTELLESPEFGKDRPGRIPPLLNEDPAKVARAAIRGIRKEKLHVCPSPFAKLTWCAAKLWPIVSRQAH